MGCGKVQWVACGEVRWGGKVQWVLGGEVRWCGKVQWVVSGVVSNKLGSFTVAAHCLSDCLHLWVSWGD